MCGYDNPTDINVYLLDTKNFPTFKISSFKVLDFKKDSEKIKINLKAKIEGGLPQTKEDNFGSFTTFVNVGGEKEKDHIKLVEMNCQLGKPTKKVDDYEINCEIINNGYSTKQKFYLYPYYYINDYYLPFEVIIPKKMESDNKSSLQFPKHGLYIFLCLLLLF